MADPDCYFFVDVEQPEENRCMSVLCVKCHDDDFPDLGWFYRGSVEGFGPFTYECCKCGDIIYKADGNDVKD